MDYSCEFDIIAMVLSGAKEESVMGKGDAKTEAEIRVTGFEDGRDHIQRTQKEATRN